MGKYYFLSVQLLTIALLSTSLVSRGGFSAMSGYDCAPEFSECSYNTTLDVSITSLGENLSLEGFNAGKSHGGAK